MAEVTRIKARQIKEGNSFLGVDCMGTGTNGTYFLFLKINKFPILVY